ncbi:putative transporter [Scedosporium apiospermum]|uniref:Putative transporter n=1 Tax=Pseudallescheria apiosperma TaxID=563466 RepID=A0A084GHB7_PSEDA|nr:putative transporter [Scedosporium apiospermum]KEZ46729.1 putative transporter [Scedosporium apiospermum]
MADHGKEVMPPSAGAETALGRVSLIISRVVTVEAGQSAEQFRTDDAVKIGSSRRRAIIVLILLANLLQFVSMFSTVIGGFDFSSKLGQDIGPGQANWMAAAYSLTQSTFVLISGRLGSVYGHQRLLLLGVVIIAIFSLVNAFCTTYTSFVAMRAITGIGGGILMPNAVATLTLMIPPGKARNFTLAVFAASPPLGAMTGALLAGAFLQYSAWKYFFVLVACLGAVTVAGLVFVLPREEPQDRGGKIDYVGIFLGLAGLLLFNISWNQSTSLGWQSASVIAMLVVSFVLLVAFFFWESRWAAEPIMPPSLFKTSNLKALTVVVLSIYMSVGILLWYMVAWQQLVRKWDTLHVALGWIPYGVGASIAVLLAAALIPIMEAKFLLAMGCVALIIATVLMATMPAQQIYRAQVFPATFISSFCADFVYVAAQVIVSNSVSKRDQGPAGSLIGTLNLYGNSLGLGFAGTIEVQVVKHTLNEVTGFRAALWFGFGLAVLSLVLSLTFVKIPRDRREGWDEDVETI